VPDASGKGFVRKRYALERGKDKRGSIKGVNAPTRPSGAGPPPCFWSQGGYRAQRYQKTMAEREVVKEKKKSDNAEISTTTEKQKNRKKKKIFN